MTWSLPEEPVSLASATPGAAGGSLVDGQGLGGFGGLVAGRSVTLAFTV